MILLSKSSSSGLILSYKDSELSRNRKKIIMLRNLLHAEQDDDFRLVINEGAPDEIVSIIMSFFEKFNVSDVLEIEPSLKDTLKRVQDDRSAFNIFSEAARKIRNDNHNEGGMADFVQSLHNFKRQLKPYQLLASYHLVFAQNAANFSVPGAGKTSVVLAAYNYLRKTSDSSKRVGSLVVVSPLAAFKAWRDEYFKCFGYRPNVLEIHGNSEKPKRVIRSELLSGKIDFDIILVNYQSLSSLADELASFLYQTHGMLVLDEAHRIKKVEGGQWSNAALAISSKAKSRVVLTGTPAPNGFVDLKNLFDFIWPGKNIIGFSAAQLRDITITKDPYQINALNDRIQPFYMRVNKKMLELPPAKYHNPIMVEMDSEQREIYMNLANDYLSHPKRVYSQNPSTFRAKLIRLRQAASNPSLILSSLSDNFYEYDEDSDENIGSVTFEEPDISQNILSAAKSYRHTPPKFIATLDLIKELKGKHQKVIIWCEFVKNIEQLGIYLKANGINVEYLYGSVQKDIREKIIDTFMEDSDKIEVVIANPHAVGESISLHENCHNAIYFEMSFNAAAYMQSKDRIHRLGLPNDVITNYYYISTKDTVDETIFERVMVKEKNMLELLDTNQIPLLANNLDFENESTDDIKAVMRDYYRFTGIE